MGRRNGRRHEWISEIGCVVVVVVGMICIAAVLIAASLSDARWLNGSLWHG